MVQQVDKAVLEKIINVVMIIDYDQGCDDHGNCMFIIGCEESSSENQVRMMMLLCKGCHTSMII